MTSPSDSAYCFVSEKSVHCIPLDSLNTFSDIYFDNSSLVDRSDYTPNKLHLLTKNLVYSLNNPTVSDVEDDDAPSPSPSAASYKTHSIYLPKFIVDLEKNLSLDFDQVKTLLCKVFSWTDVEKIDLNQLTGGITNMLLEVNYKESNGLENGELESGNKSVNGEKSLKSEKPALNELSELSKDDFKGTESSVNLQDLIQDPENCKVHSVIVSPDNSEEKNEEISKIYEKGAFLSVPGIEQSVNLDDPLSSESASGPQKCLVRIYGHGTNLIIDRHREFISHLILNSLNFAPPVYSRFKNGVIYGFLPGKSLKPRQLKNENLYPLVAQLLGQWHLKIDSELIEAGIEKLRNYSLSIKKKKLSRFINSKKKFIKDFYELIEQWISIVPLNASLIDSFNSHLDVEVNESNLKEVIQDEFVWLKSTLETINSPIVSCHCDLLSGNVIVPEDFDFDKKLTSLPEVDENPIKFIDYEYMLPGPRAFDIANHFAEWQGFDCDRSAIPEPTLDNPILINFAKGYLNNSNAEKEEIETVVKEIIMFYGLPGFYWGIWAIIQSEISNIDFDYSSYGSKRLEEYWDWKKNYLNNLKGN